MLAVSLAQLRTHAHRLVATGLAIVIAVGFVVATLVLNHTTKTTVLDAVAAQYHDSAAVITVDPDQPPDLSSTSPATLLSGLRRLQQVPGVRAITADQSTFLNAKLPGGKGYHYAQLTSLAADPSLRWQKLSSGRFPTAAGEVVIGRHRGVTLGSTIAMLIPSRADGQAGPTVRAGRIVGIIDLTGAPGTADLTQIFATSAQAGAWGATDPQAIRISADPGVGDQTLANRVRDLITASGQSGLIVRTGDQEAVKVAGTYTGAAAGITQILLVFATVAVLVCGLVIANTFTVLLAQRVRELALLRCVGATGRQLRRGALIESVITGVAASALGVLAGICMAAGVSALAGRFNSPIPLAGVSVGAQSILIGMAVGVAVTVVAAYAPARRATRVAPLAALRPQDPPSVRTRVGLLRRAAGLLLLIPGGAVLGYGAAVGNLLIALPGGVLSFIGIIVLSAWLVPPVVTGIGRLIGPAGRVPGELAALNATRNPQRTASTAIALIIGVTLTTTMVVGAASTRASASSLLDDAFPTDVVIENNSSAPLPQSLGRAVSTVPDVRAVLALPSALVHGPGTDAQVLGIDPAAAAGVVRSTEGAGVPEPGTISVPDYLGSDWKVHEGGSVPLSVGTSRLSLRVHLVSSDTPVSMTATDLAKLAPTAGIGEIWVRLASGLDADGRSDALDNISGAATDLAPGSNVQGASEERDGFDKLVNTLLLVVTGLLAVAVVIAVIGVGNTMALSVLERRQESGLLRALGLTRTQLRWMLLWEALLIAGVAALLGTVLGACYGALGTSAALSAAGSIRVVIPWSQLLAIVVVATAAGALASVLPSRRAARTPPVVAIAG